MTHNLISLDPFTPNTVIPLSSLLQSEMISIKNLNPMHDPHDELPSMVCETWVKVGDKVVDLWLSPSDDMEVDEIMDMLFAMQSSYDEVMDIHDKYHFTNLGDLFDYLPRRGVTTLDIGNPYEEDTQECQGCESQDEVDYKEALSARELSDILFNSPDMIEGMMVDTDSQPKLTPAEIAELDEVNAALYDNGFFNLHPNKTLASDMDKSNDELDEMVDENGWEELHHPTHQPEYDIRDISDITQCKDAFTNIGNGLDIVNRSVDIEGEIGSGDTMQKFELYLEFSNRYSNSTIDEYIQVALREITENKGTNLYNITTSMLDRYHANMMKFSIS